LRGGVRDEKGRNELKIISDSLEPVIERWDDPGDYPNNVASAPLPSHDCVAAVEGEVVVELEPGDFLPGSDMDVTEALDLPHGIKVRKWRVEGRIVRAAIHAVLTVEEFDAEEVEVEPAWEED
jgi:hypothetical protein